MIKAIVNGLISLLMSLVTIITVPIDTLIETVLPDLSNAISAVGQFLSLIGQGLGWAISLFGLPSEALSLLVLYFTFKLTAPLLFSTIKTAIAWYDKLKL